MLLLALELLQEPLVKRLLVSIGKPNVHLGGRRLLLALRCVGVLDQTDPVLGLLFPAQAHVQCQQRTQPTSVHCVSTRQCLAHA